jgi:hypothetical protein
VAGAGVGRNAARDLRVRGGDGAGECDLARAYGAMRFPYCAPQLRLKLSSSPRSGGAHQRRG